MRKFIVLEAPTHLLNRSDPPKKGDIVYEYCGYDYGLTRDDIRAFGEAFIAVSFKENDEYFFTMPTRQLNELSEVSGLRNCTPKSTKI